MQHMDIKKVSNCNLYGSIPQWLGLSSDDSSNRSLLHLHDNHFSGDLPYHLTNDESKYGNLIILGNKFRRKNNKIETIGINPHFENIDCNKPRLPDKHPKSLPGNISTSLVKMLKKQSNNYNHTNAYYIPKIIHTHQSDNNNNDSHIYAYDDETDDFENDDDDEDDDDDDDYDDDFENNNDYFNGSSHKFKGTMSHLDSVKNRNRNKNNNNLNLNLNKNNDKSDKSDKNECEKVKQQDLMTTHIKEENSEDKMKKKAAQVAYLRRNKQLLKPQRNRGSVSVSVSGNGGIGGNDIDNNNNHSKNKNEDNININKKKLDESDEDYYDEQITHYDNMQDVMDEQIVSFQNNNNYNNNDNKEKDKEMGNEENKPMVTEKEGEKGEKGECEGFGEHDISDTEKNINTLQENECNYNNNNNNNNKRRNHKKKGFMKQPEMRRKEIITAPVYGTDRVFIQKRQVDLAPPSPKKSCALCVYTCVCVLCVCCFLMCVLKDK